MTLSEELTWRGFVNQTTLDDLGKLDKQPATFYCGYDASADSLTIGNLAALMMNKCFIRHGYKAVLLAGGATSLIGDPGGKDAERQLQSTETVAANVEKVKQQIEKLFGGKVTMVNNLDWFGRMNVLEFLRDVGKHYSMTPLVQRDYIAKRMGEGGAGISYTEFSYTLLQGYDFLRLYEDHGVTLQLAGADQWGNGLSGVDLVRRVKGAEVNVVTCPLVVNKATGKKFGKSEDGAIWLDPAKTSVFKFYQYWLNADDDGVIEYLRLFTELDKPEIDRITQQFNENRGERLAQKTLAFEVTKLVHGQDQAALAQHITQILFEKGDYERLAPTELELIAKEFNHLVWPIGFSKEEMLEELELASSLSDARRLIDGGAIYINGRKINLDTKIKADDFLNGKYAIVKRGKNNFGVLEYKQAK